MSEIDREQVRHVARLARLELSDAEVERLTEELGRVLSRFRELEAAEEDGAGEAGAGGGPADETPAGGAGLRPDRPDADRLARPPGELAPDWEDGFFLVPRLEALGSRTEDGEAAEAAEDAGDAGGDGG